MVSAEVPESKPPKGITAPRWMVIVLALIVWLIGIPLAHGVLPWAISTRMPRYGWAKGVPGIWNRLGLIPVAVAAAILIWILVSGIPQTPKRLKLGLRPSFLNVRGPYKYTRNPMYVAELLLWLGWTIYFGSAGVLLGFLVLWSVVELVVLPREERGLETAFGATYLRYKTSVPRWLRRSDG